MPSASYTQHLLEKIRALPEDKIAEVEDFVDFLKVRGESPQPVPTLSSSSPQERLENAARDGLVRLQEPSTCKSSTEKTPPLRVGGKPASEMVIEDRR